jgi:hypothetical protein
MVASCSNPIRHTPASYRLLLKLWVIWIMSKELGIEISCDGSDGGGDGGKDAGQNEPVKHKRLSWISSQVLRHG